jgi:L-fucose isomerase-like protein
MEMQMTTTIAASNRPPSPAEIDHQGSDANQLPRRGVTSQVLANLLPAIPPAEPSRIVIVACGVRIHFPWRKTCASYDQAVAEMSAALSQGAFEVVRADAPFESPDALLRFLDSQLGAGIAGLVLFHASYTAGELGSHLGRWLLDHNVPLMSWSIPDVPGGRMEANSLCCQNFLLGMFSALGVRYAWLHAGLDNAAHPQLKRFARTVRARSRFRHGRVLHIGGSRVPAFYDGETNELAVMKRFGLRFDRIDLEAAFDYARRFKEKDVRQLRDAVIDSPLCTRNDVPEEQILQTLRLGMAALGMAAEQGHIGCTIKSWPELFEQYGCAADGAVSMLNDAGLCTAEEGEMNGVISSLALHLLSEGAAVPTMMDLSGLDPAMNRIKIWHCGAAPTRFLRRGTTYEARRHSILENADSSTAVGLMLEFLLQPGPATVVRYQSPDAATSFSFEGELVDAPLAFRGNYAEMQPAAPNTAERIMGTILGKGLDHHWSLGFGHWGDDVAMLNHWLDVKDLAVSHHGGTAGLSLPR